MSDWYRTKYGDPCRECRYDWPASLDAGVEVVRQTPTRMRVALGGNDGSAQVATLGWDARSYICHVADNLRVWAERVVAATGEPELPVGMYDVNLLAEARVYRVVPLAGALWSIDEAVAGWTRAIDGARESGVTLIHPERGRLTLEDVVTANAHDAYHHVLDVQGIVAKHDMKQ